MSSYVAFDMIIMGSYLALMIALTVASHVLLSPIMGIYSLIISLAIVFFLGIIGKKLLQPLLQQ